MVNIWDSDYPLNPNNSKYLKLLEHLNVDWKIVREIYNNLPGNDRREVDIYIAEINHGDIIRYLDNLDKWENNPSSINIPTKVA